MKKTLIFIYDILYFTIISVPLASVLYIIANTYFELKRILWKK